MDRREIIKGLLAISATGAAAACSDTSQPTVRRAPNPEASHSVRFYRPGQFLTPDEMRMLSALSQTIIPQTDTAGAIEAGVPGTLQTLLSEWADDGMRAAWRKSLVLLEYALDKAAGTRFATASQEAREVALGPIDAAVFAGERNDLGAYKDLKFTIATAYYMSEPGATEELRYEALPGRWVGCMPLEEVGRTWAT